ncbi:MAG: hypothetical protein WAK95_20300 [Desulfobacterales bacterium]
MHAKDTAGLFISLQRTIFNGAFETLSLLQDEAAELHDGWLRKMGVVPHFDAALGQWLATFKQGRNDLKRLVDSHFKKMESIWPPTTGGKIAGTIMPSAAETGEKRKAA